MAWSYRPTDRARSPANKITPYLDYVRERVAAFPDLRAKRLTRELRERGYTGDYTAVKRLVANAWEPQGSGEEID